MSGFAFKQFKVQQLNTAMKVSTDGILLGAWTNLSNVKRLLDIGCGTGLLSLMCKQRMPELDVEAIEIDEGAYKDAFSNIWQSPWPDIQLHQGDISTFKIANAFDMVICNPPYFNQSLKGPNKARNIARHTDSLSFSQLLAAFLRLSHEGSKLSVILPCTEAELFIELAAKSRVNLYRHCFVSSTPEKAPSRSLMEFGFKKVHDVELDSLVIYEHDKQYSKKFVALCQAFYLKM